MFSHAPAQNQAIIYPNRINWVDDDGGIHNGQGFSKNRTALYLGDYHGRHFLNFSKVQIPPGATLTTFALSLYCYGNSVSASGAHSFNVVCADDTNPVSPISEAELNAFTQTPERGGREMEYPVPNGWWTLDQTNDEYLLLLPPPFDSGIMKGVQALIDTPGWAYQNNLMLLLQPDGPVVPTESSYGYFGTKEVGLQAVINFTYTV